MFWPKSFDFLLSLANVLNIFWKSPEYLNCQSDLNFEFDQYYQITVRFVEIEIKIYVCKYIKISLVVSFFWPALLATGFSIRILIFDQMELELPGPASHLPSQGTCLHRRMVYPPPKYVCKYMKIGV